MLFRVDDMIDELRHSRCEVCLLVLFHLETGWKLGVDFFPGGEHIDVLRQSDSPVSPGVNSAQSNCGEPGFNSCSSLFLALGDNDIVRFKLEDAWREVDMSRGILWLLVLWLPVKGANTVEGYCLALKVEVRDDVALYAMRDIASCTFRSLQSASDHVSGGQRRL